MTARLILASIPLPMRDSKKTASFRATLESSGELVVADSHMPLVDGARELLNRGFDPATPLVMRHAGANHDSFRPMPVSYWASRTYTETPRTAVKPDTWRPYVHPAYGGTVDS